MPGFFIRRPAGTPKTAYTAQNPAGNQQWGDGQAKDFDVKAPITLTKIGVFDASANGIADRVMVCIYSRTTQAIMPGLGPFAITNVDTLIGSYRMRTLPASITLPPGQYCVMTIGTANDQFGNRSAGNTIKAPTNSVAFGGCRYGSSPGSLQVFYPTITEAKDYDTGNFEFIESSTATRTLLVGATTASSSVLAAFRNFLHF